MKIVVSGANGQLGSELVRMLGSMQSSLGAIDQIYQQAEVIPVDIDSLDITDISAVSAFYKKQGKVDITINCAAYTRVDDCETDADNAFRVNFIGARNLAMAAEEQGGKLVQVSTDYVFAGDSPTPYSEYDLPNPQSVYGKTKLMGEKAVSEQCKKSFIVRTAWLYGLKGGNFVKTMIRLAKQNGSIKVVDDQTGNPTNAEDLAYHILKLCLTEQYGIYHCTGKGSVSWFEFASEAIRLAGIECEKTPCTSAEFKAKAKRPAFSSLEHNMLRITIGDEMRDWKSALADYIAKLKEENIG